MIPTKIEIEEVCKAGYRVIVSVNSHFKEIQGIHYGVRLIVIRHTPEGIFGARAKMSYSQTDKKVMKSVWQKYEEVPTGKELTLLQGVQQ